MSGEAYFGLWTWGTCGGEFIAAREQQVEVCLLAQWLEDVHVASSLPSLYQSLHVANTMQR